MLDEHLPRAVADITTTQPDVVAFACTSAGALRGNVAEEALVASISDRRELRPSASPPPSAPRSMPGEHVGSA